MSHVMIDLETWGVRPGCAIRSIGAVVFDPKSKRTGDEFYVNVELKSCMSIGLRQEKGTIDWWNQASNEEARKVFEASPALGIRAAISQFDKWFRKQGGRQFWSHGANFDEPIMVHVYDLLSLTTPWKFFDTRCTRTIYDAADFDPRNVQRDGTHHNALDDAKYQALCVQTAYDLMRCE